MITHTENKKTSLKQIKILIAIGANSVHATEYSVVFEKPFVHLADAYQTVQKKF